jgi:CheY-like chemotaxis protein
MVLTATKRALEVLLVDDNSGDAFLTRELLAEARTSNHVNVASSGPAALQFLHKEGPFADAPTTDLVLLDINMPGMNGLEVLREIRSDGSLEGLPVIMLSTSDSEEDINRSYELHANCYLTKPGDLEQFSALVRSIDDFWFALVRLPCLQESRSSNPGSSLNPACSK